MSIISLVFLLVLASFLLTVTTPPIRPDARLTPGDVATTDLATFRVPDPVLTPGVVRPLSIETVCETRWGLDARSVGTAMKKRVSAAYGIPWADHAKYEFDHKVPRALSGDDKDGNLWPEPLYEAKHYKDPLEVRLWRMTCAGEISLADEQAAFLGDWRIAYTQYIGARPSAHAAKKRRP